MNNDQLNQLLNETFEITIGKKATGGTGTRTFQVKLSDFPEHAIRKIIAYGVQRTFNDKVGGSDTSLEEKAKAIQLLIARWKRGDIGRAPAESVDAVTAEARKLVGARLRKTRPDLWKRIKDRDDKGAILDKIVAQNPAIRAQAEELVRKRQEVSDMKLGDLEI